MGLCERCKSLALIEWDWQHTSRALEDRAKRDPTLVLDTDAGRLRQTYCCFLKRAMPDVHAVVSCPWFKDKDGDGDVIEL